MAVLCCGVAYDRRLFVALAHGIRVEALVVTHSIVIIPGTWYNELNKMVLGTRKGSLSTTFIL